MGGRSGNTGRNNRPRIQPPVTIVVVHKEPIARGYTSDEKEQIKKQQEELAAQPEADINDLDNWLLQNTKRQGYSGVAGTTAHLEKEIGRERTPTKNTGIIDPGQQHINPKTETYMTVLTQNEKRETAAFLDAKTGDILGGVIVGTSDAVQFDQEIEGTRDKVLTHTHPSSSSLSSDDVYMLERSTGLSAVRATGAYQDKEGNTLNYIYTMEKEPGREYELETMARAQSETTIPGTKRRLEENIQDGRRKIDQQQRAAVNKYNPEYEPRVMRGEIGHKEAWIEHSHKANKDLAIERNLIYTRVEPSGRVEKQYPSGHVEVYEPGIFDNTSAIVEDNLGKDNQRSLEQANDSTRR